jgi:hypothetical protein
MDRHRAQVLTRDELVELRTRLERMSVTAVHDFYFSAHLRCQLKRDGELPAPRDIQELVQAWKQIRSWSSPKR